MGVLVYSPNNSGGSWWLDTADYEALEAAGWVVSWVTGEGFLGAGFHRYGKEVLTPVERTAGLTWLGGEAGTAAVVCDTADQGVADWERITGESSTDPGCGCCGPPHSFTFYPNAPDSWDESVYRDYEMVYNDLGWI